MPNTDPDKIISGFDSIYEILENESGIRYEGEINVPDSGLAIFGNIHFTGPIGMKNKIKVDASRVERMIDRITPQTVTVTYPDLSDFSINGYSLNEVIAEKIRSMMQRSKVRDYYDVWKMFTTDKSLDSSKIGKMVVEKCKINDIDYNPAKIFDSTRLNGLEEYWEKDLGRLIADDLPSPKTVFKDIKGLLTFLPNSVKT